MVGLGRDTEPGGYDAQAYQNSSKLYAQEIAVDSLRHSDVRICPLNLTPAHTTLTVAVCLRSGPSR